MNEIDVIIGKLNKKKMRKLCKRAKFFISKTLAEYTFAESPRGCEIILFSSTHK